MGHLRFMTLVTNPKELGEFIRLHRQAMGWTQIELADAAQVGRRFVSELERGKETCHIKQIIHVLEALDLILNLTPRRNSLWVRSHSSNTR